MNKKRRAGLEKIKNDLEIMAAGLENAEEDLQDLMSEEEEAFEALPDSLQEAERGEKMSAAIDAMEQAIADLDDAKDRMSDLLAVIAETLAEAVSSIEVAVE